MKTILVVAAHGDDEVLGCGGTIAKHTSIGDNVHLIIMADGVTSRGSNAGQGKRDDATQKSADVLGIKKVHRLGLPDNKMDSLALLDIVQPLETIISDVKPEMIYTHHSGDLNIDHVLTNKAVMTACRPQPGHPVKTIYSFEVLSSTEWAEKSVSNSFNPNVYIDISQHIKTKLKALKCYDMEMRDAPHARSYKAAEVKAQSRGYEVGLEYAEAFTLIRDIQH